MASDHPWKWHGRGARPSAPPPPPPSQAESGPERRPAVVVRFAATAAHRRGACSPGVPSMPRAYSSRFFGTMQVHNSTLIHSTRLGWSGGGGESNLAIDSGCLRSAMALTSRCGGCGAAYELGRAARSSVCDERLQPRDEALFLMARSVEIGSQLSRSCEGTPKSPGLGAVFVRAGVVLLGVISRCGPIRIVCGPGVFTPVDHRSSQRSMSSAGWAESTRTLYLHTNYTTSCP